MRKPEEMKPFFDGIRREMALHKQREVFIPCEMHITASLWKNKYQHDSYYPIEYWDYDPLKKQIKGYNPKLIPMLVDFFGTTNNHHLIRQVKDFLL